MPAPSPKKTPLGFYQIHPLPSEAELRKYYEEKYYTAVKPDMYRQNCPEEMEMLGRINRWAADEFLRLKPRASASGFLDVGCGPGYLMAEMDSRGLKVRGIDPDPEACRRYNPGVADKVRRGFSQDLASWKGEAYDWINFSHVLEHVPDPLDTLRLVKSLLSPGGVLRISVPNDFSLFQNAALERGLARSAFWVCPPDHLNYFSAESLENTLKNAGFAVEAGHADFPIDLFLLLGRDYTSDPEVGKACHFERLRFESALPEMELRRLYQGFYRLGIGRSLVCYAR